MSTFSDLESADLPVNEFARKKCKRLHFHEINRNYRAQKLEVVKLEKNLKFKALIT